VSLVISRKPLEGRGQLSKIYVIAIKHRSLASPIIERVIRALENDKSELPGQEDLLTQFVDRVGAQLLVAYDRVHGE